MAADKDKGGHDGYLGAVYDSRTTADVAALYDKWAATYDAEMALAGYRHPSICLALLRAIYPVVQRPCSMPERVPASLANG